MPKLQISTEGNTDMSSGAYLSARQTISMNPLWTAGAREHKDMLRHVEHTLAHEFGHHVIWSKYRRSASEHEANMIAKQLTGMTPREAETLLFTYDLPHGLLQKDMIEEELERAGREKEDLLWAPFVQYAPSWVSRKMKDMETRQGKCYELAWTYVAYGDEGSTLVHGEVLNPTLGRMMGHAWVITETGSVYEPVSDLYFPKDDLYKTFKMKEINTYTPTEARKMTLQTKNYGPWTDEERKVTTGGWRYGSKVRELLFSKKEDAEQSVEDYMAILPSDLRDKRVSRVWFDPSVGYWRAGIYIKEVINPEVAPQAGSNLLQYYKVPPSAL
jgi:hypothetical protein